MLVANAANFDKGVHYDKARVVVGNGLPASSGAFHRRQRRCPMYMVSLWSTMSETDLPTDVHELLPPLRDSALAVRLGNDLRSYSREQICGDLNALALGMTPQQLKQGIRSHTDNSRQKLQPLTHLGSAMALDRLTTWSTVLYERIDSRFPGAVAEDSPQFHGATDDV